jgi:hypothetical protein
MFCRKRGLTNLTIITCDMNVFDAPGTYDRVVSIEMFEVRLDSKSGNVPSKPSVPNESASCCEYGAK